MVHSLPITPEMKKSVLTEGVAQFSPPTPGYRGEQIESPASRWRKTGKVYTGVVHSDAMENALATGDFPTKARSLEELSNESDSAHAQFEGGFDHGFLTARGRFVSRNDAYKIARKARQLARPSAYDLGPNGQKQLDAYDLKRSADEPTAGLFDAADSPAEGREENQVPATGRTNLTNPATAITLRPYETQKIIIHARPAEEHHRRRPRSLREASHPVPKGHG